MCCHARTPSRVLGHRREMGCTHRRNLWSDAQPKARLPPLPVTGGGQRQISRKHTALPGAAIQQGRRRRTSCLGGCKCRPPAGRRYDSPSPCSRPVQQRHSRDSAARRCRCFTENGLILCEIAQMVKAKIQRLRNLSSGS